MSFTICKRVFRMDRSAQRKMFKIGLEAEELIEKPVSDKFLYFKYILVNF